MNQPTKPIAQLKPRAVPGALLCFLCINDARTAEALGREPEPIHPAATITNGMAICDVEGRHRIVVKTNSGLIVPEAQIPPINGHG